MTPERWEQVKTLFEAALEQAPHERAAFLEAACGGDTDLRDEVESLLASDEQGKDFIETPVYEIPADLLVKGPADTLAGRRIGPYQVLGQIGQGGMGEVYLAERADDRFRKQVAIKVVKRGMDTEAILRRFRNEQQILASLDHANIAKLLDAGTTEDGLSYFIMDYVEGLTIDVYCDTHKLPTRERLALFRTVCSAVGYAHEHYVIHRDLKPSNILITAEGVVKLLDFGIAKALNPDMAAEAVGATTTSLRPMTPEYASPEQVRGGPVTPSSDVYSLGVLLYELLTGHRPYHVKRGTPQEIERVICEKEPEKPSTMISRVEEVSSTDGQRWITLTPKSVSETRDGQPDKLRRRLVGDLDNIVLMALRKEPGRRYASAEQFAADLERYLQGRPVLARPDTAGYRAGKFVRRNKAGVAAAALLVLALLGGMVASQWQARRAERQELISRQLLYAAHMNLAFKAWENADVVQVIEQLRAHRPQPGHPDLRTFAWYYLWKLCHREVLSLPHDENVSALAFSPDGKMLAVAIGDRTVKVWDVIRRQELATLGGHTNSIFCVAFSPDGTLLATGGMDETVKLWDVAAWRERASLRGNLGWARSVGFSPDGRFLAVGSSHGPIVLWDVKTRQAVGILKGHRTGHLVFSLAFSPSGEVLASGSMDNTVRLWNTTTRQERAVLKGHNHWVRSLAFSPDGKILATGSEDATVRLWDLATRQAPIIIRAHKLKVTAVAFSPDGKLLATASTDNIVKLWDTTTWQERATIKGHTGISSIAFSPDSQRLATGGGDQTVKLWDVASPQPLATTYRFKEGIASIAYSTDGKTILIGTHSGMGKLWEATTRREIGTFQIPQKGLATLTDWALLPDGKTVATGDQDGMIKFWDIHTGREIQTLKGHTKVIFTLALSRDGKILVSTSGDLTAKAWDIETRREIMTFKGHAGQVVAAALSPDNKLVATSSDDKVAKLWDIASGREKLTFQGHRSNVTNVAFSPDGKMLATGSWDRTVKIWDVSTGRELATLRGQLDRGACLAFSPDGKTLATGGQDAMVRLWDVRTWQEMAILQGHTFWVGIMAFSPDGRTLVTVGFDETVKFWDAASDREVSAQLKE
jgi:WD40 repeat protein/tRNA A-37 threonylcarbamoyl transferase component Bud32